MAGKETEVSGKQAEFLLKGAAVAEMIIGLGIASVPGLGVAGALAIVIGAAEFVFINRLKKKKQES